MLSRNHVLQNRYRIIRPLGKGGMGHVYEAMDDAVDCIVAIKETFADTDRMRRAFEREAKLLANLRHPILPRVTHHFIEGGTQFLVMDYVEGLNLHELLALRKGAFPSEEVLPWADKLLGALQYLHSRPEPVIHRDIKPANIKLTKDDEIYLLDFGLAKGSAGQMSTMDPQQSAASIYGYTAAYAPLEQLTNAGTNAQSDLYGLGATLYHLLTGQAPLSANVRYEAVEMGAGDPLPTVNQMNSQVSQDVSQVISHAMAMSRRERLRSASEMRAALQEASRKAQEPGETRLPKTVLSDIEQAPAKEDARAVEEARVTGSTIASPTAGSPAVALPPRVVPPTIRARPPGDSTPSAEVSWPSQINTSDSQAASASQEQELSSGPAISESETARRKDVAPLSTIIAGKPAVPEQVWQQPSTAPSFLAAEKRRSGAGKIVLICGLVALVAGIALWIYFSSTSETSVTQNTNAQSSPTPKPQLSIPATYAFQRDVQNGQGVVWSVAYSPNGMSLASAGDDKKVSFWDGRSFNFNIDWFLSTGINSIAFSPDGETLASASNDNIVRLFLMKDLTGGAKVHTDAKGLTGHTDEVYYAAFSPDGKTLASASKDRTVRVWDVQRGKEIRTLAGHGDVVWSVAFSPDGKTLASASKDKTINLWNTQTWEITKTLIGHTSAAISLAFSPDGKMLASGSDDNTIKLWDTSTWQELKTLTGHTAYITSLAFSSDGQILASASNDKTVRLWNPQTGELRQILTGHTKGVTSVSFSPDGRTIVTGGRDATVKVWQ